jgi:hypothetical protein
LLPASHIRRDPQDGQVIGSILLFALSDGLGGRIPVHPRHFHVHKTNVESRAVAGGDPGRFDHQVKPLLAVVGGCYVVAFALQLSVDDFSIDQVILDVENVLSPRGLLGGGCVAW